MFLSVYMCVLSAYICVYSDYIHMHDNACAHIHIYVCVGSCVCIHTYTMAICLMEPESNCEIACSKISIYMIVFQQSSFHLVHLRKCLTVLLWVSVRDTRWGKRQTAHLYACYLTNPLLTDCCAHLLSNTAFYHCLDTPYFCACPWEMWPLHGPHIVRKLGARRQKWCALWSGIFAKSKSGF